MNNSVFGKTVENVRNHRDIKLVTSDKRRKRLVSEPNYHTSKKFSEHLMAIEVKKTKIKMSKPIYLGMSTLDISKTLMYELWCDYIKPNMEIEQNCVETEDFYKDISSDVERWFDTSNFDEIDKRPLPMGKNKIVIGLFKDEVDGKIMAEFVALRAKAYAYLINGYDDDDYDKKIEKISKEAKRTKKCVMKRRLMFENYKDCLFNGKIILKTQKRFKSYLHKVYTEEVNKIALSNNDDKRLQTFDRVTNIFIRSKCS